MVARELAGMILMGIAGFAVALMVILDSVVKRLNLPYSALVGSAYICLALVLTFSNWYKGEFSKVTPRQWKWVVMRGSFGTAIYVLALLAVMAGAPLGDASALQSTNVVAAALLGRAFLGESLRALHICALGFSVVGAVIVSKPHALFGAPEVERPPLLGYALALASGAASGGTFIAARKSQDVNPLVMTNSVCFQAGSTMWLLFLSGLARDPPLNSLSEVPGSAAAVFAALVLVVTLSACTLSAGAQLCPAAVGSTIYTSANMSLCFAAQALLHHHVPEMLSLIGACLLLFGAALMALARSLYSAAPKSAPTNTSCQDLEDEEEAEFTDATGGTPDLEDDKSSSDSSSVPIIEKRQA